LHNYFGDTRMSDGEKLLRVAGLVKDPKEAIRFITDFADRIKTDLQSKEMLKLFAQDELSSGTWLVESCAAINQPSATASASMSR
jgi:hypothetical protein